MAVPTAAEMRARTGPKPLPRDEVTATLIEGQHLLVESKRLHDEALDVLAAAERQTEDGEAKGPPLKAGQKATPPRVEEINAEQAALIERLAEHQVTIGLTGLPSGDWHRWKEEHPPREDNANDATLAHGRCNSADLFDDLGRYVTSWNGDPITADDWTSWAADAITYADRRDLVSAVVVMHEREQTRVPFLRSASSMTAPSGTA